MYLQESGEMYLETILILSRKSEAVRSIDICNYMGFSKPSVSRAVSMLKDGDFIVVNDKGYITLTQKGKTVAEKIFDRHNIIADLLQAIGVSKETALSDACKIEHCISDESFEALKKQATKGFKSN